MACVVWSWASDRHARCIILENPVVALLHRLLSPLRIDVSLRAGCIRERWIVEALGHIVCALHELRGALNARSVIVRERGFAVIVCIETTRQHHPVLDCH